MGTCWLLIVSLWGIMGCLDRDANDPDIFVDDSLLDDLGGASLESEVGGFCRSSMDCSASRCVNHQGYQFCVETCATSSDCGSGQCNPVEGDEGWCELPSQGVGLPSSGDNPTYEDVNTDLVTPPESEIPMMSPTSPGDEGCGDQLEREQLQELNSDRVANGLQVLQCDSRLVMVAREHSHDMVSRQFFAHTNPDGEQPWDRLNRNGVTEWRRVGENIAYGFSNAAEVQEGWMNSPGHRENILEDFTHAGVGIFVDGQGLIYWTQMFARFE